MTSTRRDRLAARARERLEAGAFADAATLARASLLDGPDPEAFNTLGTAHVRMGDVEPAKSAFRAAIAHAPGFYKAHANLATLLGNLGDYGRAVEHARAAVLLAPERARLRVQLVRWLIQLDRYDEAERELEPLGDDPVDAGLRAAIHASRGELSAAQASLAAAPAHGVVGLDSTRAGPLLSWGLFDLRNAARQAAKSARANPLSGAAVEIDALLASAVEGSGTDRAIDACERYRAIHGRARFTLSERPAAARGERARVVVAVWAHGLDELAGVRELLEEMAQRGLDVHVLADLPTTSAAALGSQSWSVLDAARQTDAQIAQAILVLGPIGVVDASGAGPGGRSAVWSHVAGLPGASCAGRRLGCSEAYPLFPSALIPALEMRPRTPHADGLVVAALDLPHRWKLAELERLGQSRADRVLLRGNAGDTDGVRSRLPFTTSAFELRGSTVQPVEQHHLSGASVFVSPADGAIPLACMALSLGLPLLVMAGGALAGQLEAVGAVGLVMGPEDSWAEALARASALCERDAPRILLALSELGRSERSALIASLIGAASPHGVATKESDRWVRIEDGLEILVPDDVRNISSFVFEEQGRWFEDELDFVRDILRPGDVVADIGANLGAYALPMAKRVGGNGRVLAFEPASQTAARLRRSAERNRLLSLRVEQAALGDRPGTANLSHGDSPELHQIGAGPGEQVEIAVLDAYAKELTGLAFVKLDAEGFEEPILRGGAKLLEREEPLVMFELKHGAKVNHELVEAFGRMGFAIYSYVPSLGALVPFDPKTIDGFLLNLFAARPTRAAKLHATGRLFDGRTPAQLRPDRDFAERWAEDQPYHRALALTKPSDLVTWQLMAEDRARPTAERYAAMVEAVKLALREPKAFSFEYAMTRARTLRGAGLRSLATEALAAAIEQGPPPSSAGASFLPVLPRYQQLEPRPFTSWVEAQALEASVRWSAFSACFAGESAIPPLLRLHELGFATVDLGRRLSLVVERRERSAATRGVRP